MERNFLILQPWGLGDIIFSMGVARHFLSQGRVIWPIQIEYLKDVYQAYGGIEFVAENLANTPTNLRKCILTAQAVPIRWSDTFTGCKYQHVMRAKYDMYGLDWSTWRQHATWRRWPEMENALFSELGITKGEQFNLISEVFGRNKEQHSTVKPPQNGLRNIYIKHIAGYSLFDWARVMELATEIHFVASSNIYLLEMLELTARRICLYKRLPAQPHHHNYDYILQRHKYELL